MRIRACREQTGLTQRQLGLEAGVAVSIVESWEREAYLPLARQLPLLARVLDCSIDDLFVQVESTPAPL